ncbi:hepatocyte growth factor activator [Protobothrops mucrosquamatus]|uniref:hepatocyte growth factor activator n=1 Tax=Protobothrops mucrosquamatus TaxID=103944 RepID=UPI0010FB1C22|nr:hepatocyte growth factor activator [Protobothrops mucrosquamatus]
MPVALSQATGDGTTAGTAPRPPNLLLQGSPRRKEEVETVEEENVVLADLTLVAEGDIGSPNSRLIPSKRVSPTEAKTTCEKFRPDVSNDCTRNPCGNGGTCFRECDRCPQRCVCPAEFTGKQCEVAKCFDETLYEYFETGERWARIYEGTVHACTCVNSTTNCQPEMFTVPSQNCYSKNGARYLGLAKTTVSGDDCLPWTSNLFYYEDLQTNTVLLGLGSHSYCRNPDEDEKPWCYFIKDGRLSWDYCDVSLCPFDACTGILTFTFGSQKLRVGDKTADVVCPLTSTIRVVLGQHSFNSTTGFTQEFKVEKYIVHPDFSVFNPTENDIALIKLKKAKERCAVRSQFVQHICLPEASMSFPDHYKCYVVGWGYLRENSSRYANVVQEALVPIIPDYECQNPDIYGSEISENMFCAGYLDGRSDACQGDSGGPLACKRDGAFYLYGIVSWGDGCGKARKPGVYTKVTNYVSWINQEIHRTPKG